MRKLLSVITICSVLFSACSKTDNSHSSTNTIGITDNGMALVMTSTAPASNENTVDVTLIKTASSTALVLSASNSSSNRQYELHLKAYGAYTGTGQFSQNGNNGDNQLHEFFSGGQNYTIDHSDVFVNNTNDTYITGTFTLYLSNSNGTKTVTGYFTANRPVIQ
jgi:hypothetical protein